MILPVLGSKTAASPGGVLKVNVPPDAPETFDTPPSHEEVIVKDGSSKRANEFIVTGIS